MISLPGRRTLWIFGHQLNVGLPGFSNLHKERDQILMIEAYSHSTWKKYHKKKLTLILSAMRHFARTLEEEGYQVDYKKSSTFQEGFREHRETHQPSEVIYHVPTDWKMRSALKKWSEEIRKDGITVLSFEESPLFLIGEEEWNSLLPAHKTWKLDTVYRTLRKRFAVLVDGNEPVGGKWSYDSENRKPPNKGLSFVEPTTFVPDAITEEVMKEVETQFPDHPGTTDEFSLPVTHEHAEQALKHFITARLGTFGDYQDAMIEQNPYMSHSLISSSLNIGLLDPLSVIQEAERAYEDGFASLASVEGFIRQILGWREYIRGVYLRTMPSYEFVNEFKHDFTLPAFYWNGDTKMNCIHQCVSEVVDNGYNHHIQRLMVLGNFANLLGVNPQELSDWFNTMYTDAHDWVVLPNVLGMALYADGGRMSTKPYISSGQYIHKMSNYCKSCFYHVKERVGEKACPFNALYWHFIMRNARKLSDNPRMKMMYRILEKMTEEDQQMLWKQGEAYRKDFT